MIKQILLNLIRFLNDSLLDLANYLSKGIITLSAPIYDNKGRFLLYIADNNRLLDNYEVLKLIFERIQGDKTFKEFGSRKIIYMSCIINNQYLPFHHNVLITNTTTFEEYWESIKDSVSRHYSYGITENGGIPRFEIKIWSLDNYLNRNIKGNPNVSYKRPLNSRSFHTTSLILKGKEKEIIRASGVFVKPSIKPLTQLNNIALNEGKFFSTLDIETISLKNIDHLQIPVLIASYSSEIINKIFTIDHVKLKVAIVNNDLKAINILVNELWKKYLDYIIANP